MPLNLPPDPNDAQQAPHPQYPVTPQYQQPPQFQQPQYQQPQQYQRPVQQPQQYQHPPQQYQHPPQQVQYAQQPQQFTPPPAFPDGSRGAGFREPYAVTRRNNFRVYTIVGGAIFGVLVIVGVIVTTAIILISFNR